MVFITKKKKPLLVGGAYNEIKQEERDKESNTTILPSVPQPQKKPPTGAMSDEKLKRFVNFKFK